MPDGPLRRPYSGGITSYIVSPGGMTAQAGRLRVKMAAVGWKEDRSSSVPACAAGSVMKLRRFTRSPRRRERAASAARLRPRLVRQDSGQR
jgi:hypothetical protein